MGGLGDAFAQRQRFKVLADCLLVGPAPVRPADAARVLTTAVKDSIPLVGLGDLIRIQRSQAVVNRTLRLPAGTWRTGGPTLKLQLPSHQRPTLLPVNPDAVKGAGVLLQAKVGQVHAESVKAPDDSAALSVVVARYARALESRNVALVRQVVRDFDEPSLQLFFRRADGLRAELQLAHVTVSGGSARGLVTGVFQYRDSKTHLPRQDKVMRRATFVRQGTEWQMVRID